MAQGQRCQNLNTAPGEQNVQDTVNFVTLIWLHFVGVVWIDLTYSGVWHVWSVKAMICHFVEFPSYRHQRWSNFKRNLTWFKREQGSNTGMFEKNGPKHKHVGVCNCFFPRPGPKNHVFDIMLDRQILYRGGLVSWALWYGKFILGLGFWGLNWSIYPIPCSSWKVILVWSPYHVISTEPLKQ